MGELTYPSQTYVCKGCKKRISRAPIYTPKPRPSLVDETNPGYNLRVERVKGLRKQKDKRAR